MRTRPAVLAALLLCATPVWADDPNEPYPPFEENGYLFTLEKKCQFDSPRREVLPGLYEVTCDVEFQHYHVVTMYVRPQPGTPLKPGVKSELAVQARVPPHCGPIRSQPVPGKEDYQKWRCTNMQAFPVKATLVWTIDNR